MISVVHIKCYLFLLILCWYCHDVLSINVYKKQEQFKHSSKRNTETKNFAQIYPPWYLHQIQTYFVSRPQGLHSVRARLKVWLINGRYCIERGLFHLVIFLNREKWEIIVKITEGACSLSGFCSVVTGHRDETVINRNTDFIWTIFLYTVLHVVVMNMMECYY